MHTDDLEAVLAGGYATLREAQAADAPQWAAGSRGRDRAGHVEVSLDAHGLLDDIRFEESVEGIPASELEASVLEALQDAYHSTGRPRVGSLPEIGNSEVSAQARRILGIEGD